MTCQDRRDLLLLYVTDALDAAEAIEMRQHLQSGCPQCAGHLAEAQAVITAMPMGLEPVTPPPHLREKLMQRIAAGGSAIPLRLAGSAPEDSGQSSSPIWWMRYLIPAAMAAGIAIFVTHSYMMQQVNDLQRQASSWEQKSADANAEVEQLKQLGNQFKSQTEVVEMLQSPEIKLIPLKPTALQPNAVANLLWDQKKQHWAVLTTGMSQPASGQTYELWIVTGTGAKIPAGTFDVDANGTGCICVAIPAGIGELKLAAVTNEKAGGVPQPQGSFQVMGSVD